MAAEPWRICTLVTDWQQCAAMKATFVAAGFDESHACYTPFDNTAGNTYEPYSLLRNVLPQTTQQYLILCHQDVRMDRGHGRPRLEAAVEELNAVDPAWAVAGNAGCTDDFDFILRVDDPTHAALYTGPLPVSVNSLDENFLLIGTASGVSTTTGLSGFHLYGTDLCLNARLRGRRCFVIDFILGHLSRGTFDEAFFECRRRFMEHWQTHFRATYVVREAEIFLSRWPWLRPWAEKVCVKRLLRSNRFLRALMTWEQHHPRQFKEDGVRT